MTTLQNSDMTEDNKKTITNFHGGFSQISRDLDGKYVLDSKFPSDTILVTFIGYEPQKIAIAKEVRRQVIDVKLKEESVVAKEVVIKAKRKRYRKKNNPAVALMRKVIDKKKENSIESKQFYSYDQHEKIQQRWKANDY